MICFSSHAALSSISSSATQDHFQQTGFDLTFTFTIVIQNISRRKIPTDGL